MSEEERFDLIFPKEPIKINKDTTSTQFFDEYLFVLNQHIKLEELTEFYPGSLNLSEEQIQSYLSTILLNITLSQNEQEIELDLNTIYNICDNSYYYFYYSIFIKIFQLYKTPYNKEKIDSEFIKLCNNYI